MTALLLTTDEFREHVETALPDEAVQRLLDSVEDDINQFCGRMVIGEYEEPEEVEEWFAKSSQYKTVLRTKQPYLSVTSVTDYLSAAGAEDTTTDLVVDEDYWLDGNAIRRKDGYHFGDRTLVVYVPANTVNRRRATMIQLAKLEINADPGTGFEGAGSWQHTSQDYEQQRQHLLWQLCPPPVLAQMGKTFTTRVTIQQAVETRDASGGVHHDSFTDLPGHESIPAVLSPTVDENLQERFDDDADMWQIVLAGHWPLIKPKHYVLHEGTRYEAKRISTTKRRRVTTLLARLGSLQMGLMSRLGPKPYKYPNPIFRSKGRGGVPLETRLAVYIVNGPELARQLHALDLKLSRVIARQAVRASGEVIAKAWADGARTLNRTSARKDGAKGYYAESIRVSSRSKTVAGEEGARVLSGASVSIAPATVGGVPADEQPARYAAVHEFGGKLGKAQHYSRIPASGIARKAFEGSANEAVAACEAVLRQML